MKKTFKFVPFFLVFILALNFSVLSSFASDSITVSNKAQLVNTVDAFLQEQIDKRATNPPDLTLTGIYINTFKIINGAITPNESYFAIAEPLNAYRLKDGNDYNAVCFATNNEAIKLQKSVSYAPPNNNLTFIELIYTFSYGESISQKKAVEDFCQNAVNTLITPSMSDYQKIKALHDFLVNYSKYDTSFNNAYPYMHLQNKSGICQSYSALFWMLLKKAGIECRIIIKGMGNDQSGSYNYPTANNGTSTELHAWNMVNLNSKWYHVDVTWDDPISQSGKDILSYDYFLKSSATMRKNHSWDEGAYPISADKDYETGLSSNQEKVILPVASSSSKTVSSKVTQSSATSRILNSSIFVSNENESSLILAQSEALSSSQLTIENTPLLQENGGNIISPLYILLFFGGLLLILLIGIALFLKFK